MTITNAIYAKLRSIALRECRRAGAADDVVQEAILAAVLAGRWNPASIADLRWLSGVVRNKARMEARSTERRARRESRWHALAYEARPVETRDVTGFVSGLPSSLRSVAALALSGHDRREIGHLLRLPDATLRKRISDLRRRAKAAGLAAPADLPGLRYDLPYGAMREALLGEVRRQDGALASHDPDGHLFVIRTSRTPCPRQHGSQL